MSGPGNEYVIDEHPLGHGRYGEVFRGRDAAGGPCAVRILHPQFHADPAVVRRFVQDRSLLLGLTDPHLVRLHDLVVDEGQAFGVVTDLVEGPVLRDALADAGALPAREVARLGGGVARALAAVNSAGFAHGDVKPANVLLDKSTVPPVARLADFYLTKLFGDSEFARAAAPTRTAYLAPELSLGAPPTPAGDLYALGVLLYELVAGGVPFTGNSVIVTRSHAQLAPRRPAGVPDALWDLISWLLAKDPTERPQSALDVAGLLAICAESTEDAPTGGPGWMPVPVPMSIPGPRDSADASDLVAASVPGAGVAPSPDRARRVVPSGMVAGALAGALSALVVLALGGTVWSLTKDDGNGGAPAPMTPTSESLTTVPGRAPDSTLMPGAPSSAEAVPSSAEAVPSSAAAVQSTPSTPSSRAPSAGVPASTAVPAPGPVVAPTLAPNPLNAAVAAFAAAWADAMKEGPIRFSSPAGDTWELRRVTVDSVRRTPPEVPVETKTPRAGTRPKTERVPRYVSAEDHPK